MRLRVLGSAAAEGFPALFCECEYCRNARLAGGKNLRHRTSYLLDDDTMIDCGPDFIDQSLLFNIDQLKIRRILFTHAHDDHLESNNFRMRRKGSGVVTQIIDVYGDKLVHDSIRAQTELDYRDMHLCEFDLEPGGRMACGEDMSVFAVRARHDPKTGPLSLFITRGGRRLLIQHDSGWWSEKSWQQAATQPPVDCVVLESTYGLNNRDKRGHHLGAEATVDFRDELLKTGIITEHTQCFVGHFSHNGNPMQKDLENFFLPHGIVPMFDGMNIEV